MKTLVITPKSSSELKFITELLKKLGISSRILSQEEKEEIGISILMNEVNQNEKAGREEVLKKLKA